MMFSKLSAQTKYHHVHVCMCKGAIEIVVIMLQHILGIYQHEVNRLFIPKSHLNSC